MCGIAGIVAADDLCPRDRAAVPRMREALIHRGPDDAGRYFDRHAGLAHRRLAVTDIAGGRQPLCNEDGSVWVVFNGQIYNHAELRRDLAARGHRFATRSDTEVIPHLYEQHGDDFLDRLRGMFAIALWDARRRRLLLARDRLGVKPLYYRVEPRRILFGSELKALLQAPGVPREPDVAALADYLALGFIPSPRTIFQGVCKLQPGECLAYERGRAVRRTYWRLRHPEPRNEPAEALSEELWALLEQATRERIATEVPFGAFLSGGVDSAAVVGAAAAALGAGRDHEFTTMTIGFDERGFDERAAARRRAARLGTRHHERWLDRRALERLASLAWHFDEPLADPSALPAFLLAGAARPLMTVALSGDGGDEVLAGYRRYRFDLGEERVRNMSPSWLRRGVFGAAARFYPDAAWLPRTLRARTTLANLAGDGAAAHARSVARMDLGRVRALLHPDLREELGPYDPLEALHACHRECDAAHPLGRCRAVDLRFGLGDGILTKVDRASMSHGLEVRSPLLDHRLVEFAAAVPPSLLVRGRNGKHLLRKALAARYGAAFAAAPKHGFSVPVDEWFRRGAERGCGGPPPLCDGPARGLLDERAVAAMEAEHQRGAKRHGATLWALAMLNAWASQFLGRVDAHHASDQDGEHDVAPTPTREFSTAGAT